ncbi:MAG: hypothetical protein ACXWES_08015, partial [Solirubrobacterales bacterium]
MLTALACAGVLITLAACGRSDEGKVRSVVDDYIAARAAGDAEEICSLYTEEFRRQQGLAADCPAKLAVQLKAEPKPTETTVAEVKVHEGLARVDLDVSQGSAPSRVTLGLIDKDGRWLIAA